MPRSRDPFFARMGLVLLALTLLGFPLTYYLPLATGAKQWPVIIHLHGVVFFAWIFLYAWQTHLVAAGKTARHREWGLAGIAVSTLMLPLGVAAAIQAALRRQAEGAELPFAFTYFNMVDLGLFTLFVIAAIATVTRHVEWHRRFMYAAALALLAAGLSRWFLPLPSYPPLNDIASYVLADLLLIPLALHDRRVLGRVHPATILAAAIMIPFQLSTIWVPGSVWWNGVAPLLLHLRV